MIGFNEWIIDGTLCVPLTNEDLKLFPLDIHDLFDQSSLYLFFQQGMSEMKKPMVTKSSCPFKPQDSKQSLCKL